jgi:acyl-CoA synthetase (AMP-forming)/AMP-acid ligase II
MPKPSAPTAGVEIARHCRLNVADRLTAMAGRMGDAIAVAVPGAGHSFKSITFAQLEAEVTRLAEGLAAWGVPRGARLVLLVRPGIEFVALVFALLRAGMVIVLVDPGLGRRNLVRCLGAVEPEGFVAVPIAQATRLLLRSKFPRAVWNVTAGRRWFWGGITLDQLRTMGATRSPGARSIPAPCSLHSATYPADPAAIIFTSGSTGPPKGGLLSAIRPVQRGHGRLHGFSRHGFLPPRLG